MTVAYEEFLDQKRITAQPAGFEAGTIHPAMRSDQNDITRWLVHRGRAAALTDCGTGKTFIEQEWGVQVVAHAGTVMALSPLAVAEQTIREANRWGRCACCTEDRRSGGAEMTEDRVNQIINELDQRFLASRPVKIYTPEEIAQFVAGSKVDAPVERPQPRSIYGYNRAEAEKRIGKVPLPAIKSNAGRPRKVDIGQCPKAAQHEWRSKDELRIRCFLCERTTYRALLGAEKVASRRPKAVLAMEGVKPCTAEGGHSGIIREGKDKYGQLRGRCGTCKKTFAVVEVGADSVSRVYRRRVSEKREDVREICDSKTSSTENGLSEAVSSGT